MRKVRRRASTASGQCSDRNADQLRADDRADGQRNCKIGLQVVSDADTAEHFA